MTAAHRSGVPTKAWISILVLFATVVGGVFVYRFILDDTFRGREILQEQTHAPVAEEEEDSDPVAWEDATDEIRERIALRFPECAELAPAGEMLFRADITGGGVEEVIATTGCTGAYATESVLLQMRNGSPEFAIFEDGGGNVLEDKVFLSGASLLNYLRFGMVPELQAVYQASGFGDIETCEISWEVDAYQWDEERQAFRANDAVESQVREHDREQFTSYLDPEQGPTHTEPETCDF